MVGEEDLRLCLGWSAGIDASISDSSELFALASDGRDPYTQETRDSKQKCQGKESDEEEGGGMGTSGAGRKKLRLSKEEASTLEDAFRRHHTLNPKQKLELAKELNLRPRQVEVWFQNRRARTKLKKTEVDCELLKRRCENLTEENRRLQRELLELRALKRPPPHVYMQAGGLPAPPPPPTTILAVCPSCDRAAPFRAAAAPAESKFHGRSTSLPLQLSKILLS